MKRFIERVLEVLMWILGIIAMAIILILIIPIWLLAALWHLMFGDY